LSIDEQADRSDREKQINISLSSTYNESDDEQLSPNDITVKESFKYDEAASKDTDDDASFSENEHVSSKMLPSDDQKKTSDDSRSTDRFPSSSFISTSEIIDDYANIPKTTESCINLPDQSTHANVSQPTTTKTTTTTTTTKTTTAAAATDQIESVMPSNIADTHQIDRKVIFSMMNTY
jgi:hypothetical protein